MTLNQILYGDVIKRLLDIPDGTFNAIVTSPPYYALRKYSIPDTDWPEVTWQFYGMTVTTPAMSCQMGLEPTPMDFIGHMVYVFRLARRTLRDDGVLFINIGDSYWGGKGKSGQSYSPEYQNERYNGRVSINGAHHQIGGKNNCRPTDRKHAYIKPKDKIGIPHMVAAALREDGWTWRQEIIWKKSNPMPEAVYDRCTTQHEYIFMFSKNNLKTLWWRHKGSRAWTDVKPADPFVMCNGKKVRMWMGYTYWYDGDAIAEPAVGLEDANGFRGGAYTHDQTFDNGKGGKRKTSGNKRRVNGSDRSGIPGANANSGSSVPWEGTTRNKRSVWTVAVRPFNGAHFATFPPELIPDCIKAGCPVGGVVGDLFGGSGTTALVAAKLNRNYLLIELGEGYINDIATPRLQKELGLFYQS